MLFTTVGEVKVLSHTGCSSPLVNGFGKKTALTSETSRENDARRPCLHFSLSRAGLKLTQTKAENVFMCNLINPGV